MFTKVIKGLSLEAYQDLCSAVEIGRWADGQKLTEKQKKDSLQAVLAWQALNGENQEHMQVGSNGQIVMKSKSELKRQYREEEISRFLQSE